MITYPSTAVTVTKLSLRQYNISSNKSSGLYICLNITSVMLICPTLASELLLVLAPFHIYIQKEAMRSSRTFSSLKGLKLEDSKGCVKMLKESNLHMSRGI
ncbi:hypothetical protein Trydic_g2313 [Trypoxylus dichotomus]